MDIISAIDQATGCHQCGTSLVNSVSDMFCGEACQGRWHANRVGTVATDPDAIPWFVAVPPMVRPEPHPTQSDVVAAVRALFRGI